MMHCNGKCYLYRQLKKAADEEAANNKIPVNVLKLKGIDDCVVSAMTWDWSWPVVFQTKSANATPRSVVLSGYTLSLFMPPQPLV